MRFSVGARVIQLPSGSMPTISRMRMLADLPHQRLAVVLGHPVLGLDEVAGVDARVEALPRARISSAERTAFWRRSGSLPMVSIACVYMVGSFRALLGSLVDRRGAPCRSACVRCESGGQHAAPWCVMPTRVLMRCCSHRAISRSSSRRRRRGRGCSSQRTSTVSSRPSRVTTSWYWPRELRVRQHDLLDLGREDVDAADDQHVVACGRRSCPCGAMLRAVGGSRRVRSRVR